MSPRKVFFIFLAGLLPLLMEAPLRAQTQGVSGTVRDPDGEPLPGTVIVVKGDKAGTSKANAMADAEGRYTVKCLPTDVLSFFAMGFEELEVKVEGRSVVDVVLSPDASTQLDEAVAIGYGSVKKADLTGSVTNVRMTDIQEAPDVSVDQALQGRVAGADILSTSGDPGASTTIRIRGTRSIEASNEPLIVVDDVMDAIRDISDINPADIESITVLKDASSTAIYGARGANGVILITTKTGTLSSKPNITAKAGFGISMLPSSLDVMNASEFAVYRNMYALNNNSTPAESYDPMTGPTYADPASLGKGTDWIKAITRIAPHQTYDISASGGTSKFKYYVSAGYLDHRGIIKANGARRFNGRINLDYQVNSWLKAGFRGNYVYRDLDNNKAVLGGDNFVAAAVYLSPLMDVTENFNPLAFTGGNINNPVSLVNKVTDKTRQDQFINTVYLQAKLPKNFSLRSQFTYYLYNYGYYKYTPSDMPIKVEGQGGDATRRETRTRTFNSETTLTFDKTWRKTHHLDAVAGFTGHKMLYENFQLSGSGYQLDELLWNNMNAVADKNTYNAATSTTYKNTMSVLLRANYNYRQRYYLTVSFRADGASNFAENHKWGFFPSAAFKWNIANEPWMKSAREVDELSLKLSAGRTGNDAVSVFRSLAAMTSTTSGYVFGDNQPVAYYPSRIASPELTWEKTDLYNAAITGAFFNNRISFEADVYYSRTTDLLLQVNTARYSGFSNRYANCGTTRNIGAEFTLSTRNIVRKNFSWVMDITVSHNNQKVIDVGSEGLVQKYASVGTQPYTMYGYKAGYPLNSLWGFVYAGVWHDQEEIDRNGVTRAYASQLTNQQPGMPRYIDVNHDGILSELDLCHLGNADPWLYGGIQNKFRLWRFNATMYWTYSLGGKIYNFYELVMAGSGLTNQYRYMKDAWSVTNTTSDLPAAGIIPGSQVPGSLQLHDASYLRLKTLSISYTQPFKKGIKDLKITLSGDNLLLLKKYNGFDPDVSSEGASSTLRRLDVGAYPKARMILLSVQVRY